MKVLCDSEALNKTLRIARHAIMSKSSTPIFSGFHLLAHPGQLEVVGMDLNMAISCSMEAQVEEEDPLRHRHFANGQRRFFAGEIFR